MKRIMVDLDETICHDTYLHLANKMMNATFTRDDMNGYYIESIIPPDRHSEWWDYVGNEGMYTYAKIIPHAYEVLEELSAYYELYIVSSYRLGVHYKKAGKLLNQKYEWIINNIPFIKPEHICFVCDKSIIDCEIRIDDKMSNMNGTGDLKLLFTAHHNLNNVTKEELDKKGIKRVKDWLEVKEILIDSKYYEK